jgi:hypothetical protein
MRGFTQEEEMNQSLTWFNLELMQAPKKKTNPICKYISLVESWLTNDKIQSA